MIFSAVLLAVLLVAGGLWYTRPRTFWEAAGLDPEAVTGVAGTVIEYGFQNGRPCSQSRQMENRSPGQAEFDTLMSQLDEMQFRGTLRNLLPLPSSYATDASTPSTIRVPLHSPGLEKGFKPLMQAASVLLPLPEGPAISTRSPG